MTKRACPSKLVVSLFLASLVSLAALRTAWAELILVQGVNGKFKATKVGQTCADGSCNFATGRNSPYGDAYKATARAGEWFALVGRAGGFGVGERVQLPGRPVTETSITNIFSGGGRTYVETSRYPNRYYSPGELTSRRRR